MIESPWPSTVFGLKLLLFSLVSHFAVSPLFARLRSAAALIASTVQNKRLLRLYALCTYEAPQFFFPP